jgi:hypothetical protein
MDAILSYLTSISPTFGAVIITAGIVWWACVFYHKIKRTEAELKSTNKQLADLENTCATKKDIANLKENDLFHTNKAILLLAKMLAPKEKEEGFERIKDTILETTPDNHKDEIKSITL